MSQPAGRVLLVEDEVIIAIDIARSLERQGLAVVGPAHTLSEALRLAKMPNLAGAVLDINLRGELVFPVADLLRERGVPYVFASGYGSKSVPGAHRHAPHFEKPVLPDVVLETLVSATKSDGAERLG